MNERQQQLALEEEADDAASARKLLELVTKAGEGDTTAPRAVALLARMYSEVAARLKEIADVKTRGSGGKLKGWLRKLDVDVAAVIAVRECVRLCSVSDVINRPVVFQDLAIGIGRLYELEVRIAEAEKVNPLYMFKVHDQIKDRGTVSTHHIRVTYNTAYDNIMKGEIDSGLSRSDLCQLGKHGVDACYAAGLIYSVRLPAKGGVIVVWYLVPEVWDFLHSYNQSDVRRVTDKQNSAMLCHPDTWENHMDGGYLSLRRKTEMPLLPVRQLRKSVRQRIADAFTAEAMPVPFKVANYLQGQAFALHQPTYTSIVRVWEQGGGVLGVPQRAAPAKPPFPFADGWDKNVATPEELDSFMLWKRKMARYYTNLKHWRGKVQEVGEYLRAIKKTPARMWFPTFYDTRSRLYYRGLPNPQGSDLAKGALHFADKKPLGPDGVFWLKVHIANAYGYDKVRFSERVKWVDRNWMAISLALDEPENKPEVFGKDSPWVMFGAAWELREALRSGNPEAYCTGIPVHMDATCSGLQHFSAALRDPEGARYVNLYDAGGECKADIYSMVASLAMQAITNDLSCEDLAVRKMAEFWHRVGMSRALAKKPIMTYVYGATIRSTAQHIAYVLDEQGVSFPEEAKWYEYCNYAAHKLFRGIAETVPAAAAAMRWLKEVAQAVPCGKRMEWRTPTNFLAQQDYIGYDLVRVKVRSCGLDNIMVRNYNDKTVTHKMSSAAAPNFVHSMDASHMMLVSDAMQDAGACMVAIHDSFGTHPSDVRRMHGIIRDTFVKLYHGKNPLAEFLWDAGGIGNTPPRGNFDINQVLDSEFFFC